MVSSKVLVIAVNCTYCGTAGLIESQHNHVIGGHRKLNRRARIAHVESPGKHAVSPSTAGSGGIVRKGAARSKCESRSAIHADLPNPEREGVACPPARVKPGAGAWGSDHARPTSLYAIAPIRS